MRRTPRAEQLRGSLKALLADVQALVDPPDIPLAEIRQTIRFATSDQIAALLLPGLFAALAHTAPGIDLILPPWRGAAGVTEDLLRGEAGLALSLFEQDVPGLSRRLALNEHYAVFMRPDHPAADGPLDLDRWLSFPHIVVSGHGDRRGSVDMHLERLGKARRVGLVVPSFQIVPGMLRATDFIATLPGHSLLTDDRKRLVTRAPPLPIPGFPMHFAWPSRSNGDKALMHVMETLAGLLADEMTRP